MTDRLKSKIRWGTWSAWAPTLATRIVSDYRARIEMARLEERTAIEIGKLRDENVYLRGRIAKLELDIDDVLARLHPKPDTIGAIERAPQSFWSPDPFKDPHL